MTGKQRRHLRGLGHGLAVVVQVGKEGVTDGVVHALDAALHTHELVKVKVAGADDRHDEAEALAKRTGADLVQVLGNTALLYRADPDDPKIELPAS